MLTLNTDIVGKQTMFGDFQARIHKLGYSLGGHWDYDHGCFDTILWREGGETIYLRIPFIVVEGELDQYGAIIKFKTPYVIKHIVNLGLDSDENSLITAVGFNQFQDPIDQDGPIQHQNKWTDAGERAVSKVIPYLRETS